MKIHVIFLGLVISSQCIYGTLAGPYNALYNFGDSISDTGNCLIYRSSLFQNAGQLPYGMTFFSNATGRFSNGRLIVDFFAETFGLPYPIPSLVVPGLIEEKYPANELSSINFAVAGANAIDAAGNNRVVTNASLGLQIDWFRQLKPYLCDAERDDCKSFFANSLFIVGEFGGNDYSSPLLDGVPLKEIAALIPQVVEAIGNGITELIKEGATQLVVPGIFPNGCTSIYLSKFRSDKKTDYDRFGCLKSLNDFSRTHNSMLKSSLEKLQQRYPDAKIIYADYYGATRQYIKAPTRYGFARETLLKACCGGGGKYNFNYFARCGSDESTVCEDLLTYQNWDGAHYTEAAYQVITDGLLYDGFTTPPLIPDSSDIFVRGRVPAELEMI